LEYKVDCSGIVCRKPSQSDLEDRFVYYLLEKAVCTTCHHIKYSFHSEKIYSRNIVIKQFVIENSLL